MRNYTLVHISGAGKQDRYMVNGKRVSLNRFDYLESMATIVGIIDCIHTVTRKGRVSQYKSIRL